MLNKIKEKVKRAAKKPEIQTKLINHDELKDDKHILSEGNWQGSKNNINLC